MTIPIRIIEPIINRGMVTIPKCSGFGISVLDEVDMHAPLTAKNDRLVVTLFSTL